ncbi:MAG: polysaccharide biosynthesis protein [Clostridia bacterium]|nr:polysaccharide biosynthesis protein [Clostridia bacterium]
MAKKKQGFVYGALILMLSNIIVKAVGALFKIPLANCIGDTAMGYFSSAYSIYSMCFLISTAGLPVAISRMIAASRAKGREKEVDAIYRVSLLIFLGIGILGTAGLFFGADAIASVQGEPDLALCIKTISPIMFFICLVSCIRGYFQGGQNMIPTAISQVIEVMGNLCLGLTAGVFASRAGHAPAVVAAFALGGVTLGIVASAIYMSLAKFLADRDAEQGSDAECRSKKSLAKELIAIAVPITISSSVMSLTSVIDSILAVRRLNDACVGLIYFAVNEATPVAVTLYGAYMAKAVTLFNLPPTIIYPFAISIIPAISSADASGDRRELKKTMDFTFRIVSVICLPCAVGLGVMAKPIIDLLFSSGSPIFLTAAGNEAFSNAVVAPMLTVLAAAIVFSGLISVSGSMLQASGFAHLSIISTCCGVAAKAVSAWILIGIPSVGYYGIPLSTLLCYVIMFCFNLYFLSSRLHYRLSFGGILLKPLLSAALCGAVAGGAHLVLDRFLPGALATVGGIGAAALVYVIALFLSRGFGRDDVLMLPKGASIARLLTRVHLLRDE